MDIDKIFSVYQNENSYLIEYIQKIAIEKQKSGDWYLGILAQSPNLLVILMYEYATSIEKLTSGKISAQQVVDKISSQMGIFRIGDFIKGKDDKITYDGYSVTSDEFKKKCRIEDQFGALTTEYYDKEGKHKSAVSLFDNNQFAIIDGKKYQLYGINLRDLGDIRQSAFHEWTHIMEECIVKACQLSREDIIFENGKSIFINSKLCPMLSREEFEQYIYNIDNLLNSDEEVYFSGITTIEIENKKNPNGRIMHNKISEGVTEYIARLVMETIREEIKHPERYFKQVKIAEGIFKGRGLSDTLVTYFTESYKLIRSLESTRVCKKDMLHYISNYINSAHYIKRFNKLKIDQNGNVQLGFIQNLSNRIRNILSKREVVSLPKTEKSIIGSKKINFTESIKNFTQENNNSSISNDTGNIKIQGPSLDDKH